MPRSRCRISTDELTSRVLRLTPPPSPYRALSSGSTMVFGRSAPSPHVATMSWRPSIAEGAKLTIGNAFTLHYASRRGAGPTCPMKYAQKFSSV